ncbi:cache domain-containing sensor histidine kinase [Paenibacillus taihuensis]|nr:sensor histidine kinase [Paenibacillus taihuensis]
MMMGKGWLGLTMNGGMTMQKKLIVVFIFLILIPIVAIGYISYENYLQSINKNTKNYVAEVVAKMQSKLDDSVSDMNAISKIPLYSEELQQYLAHSQKDLDEQRRIDFYIGLMNNIRKDTYSVYIFDNYGNVFYRLKTDSVRSDLQSNYANWRSLARKAEGDPVLMGTQKLPDTVGGNRYVFTVLREIKDISSLEPVGTVMVDAGIGVFKSVVQELNEVTKGKTVIVDRDGSVIYDNDQQRIGVSLAGNADLVRSSGKSGSFDTTMDGVSYICTYTVSQQTGWKMLVYVPVNYLHKDAVLTRNVTLSVTAAITLFALAISIVLSFTMTSSLRTMTRLMKQVQGGNLDVAFQIRQNDEIGLFGREFNRMLRRIKELIAEIYDISARKKETELEALQSQINPHFIYNTLETIRMNAVINDDDEVAEMTFTLGKLLRYSINRGREIVTVEEELEHLENYVELLRYRFKNRFELEYDIPGELMSFHVMKLMFQPIVENAILHGMEGKDEKVRILLSARTEGDMAIFVLRDEGVGMDSMRLHLLRGSIQGLQAPQDGTRTGVGLRNINERIKLHYGESYGIEVDSRPDAGTEVRLRLPYKRG